MRRRPNRALYESIPIELRRFAPDDWPGHEDVWAALDAWKAARSAFRSRNGWPTSAVDFIRGHVDAHRSLFAIGARLTAIDPTERTTR